MMWCRDQLGDDYPVNDPGLFCKKPGTRMLHLLALGED